MDIWQKTAELLYMYGHIWYGSATLSLFCTRSSLGRYHGNWCMLKIQVLVIKVSISDAVHSGCVLWPSTVRLETHPPGQNSWAMTNQNEHSFKHTCQHLEV